MRKLTFKFSKLAPVALLVAGVLVAGEARADRKCLEDPALTGRACSEARCIEMSAEVDLACKAIPAPTSCYKVFGCAARQAMRQRWVDCRQTRIDIRAECWPLSDSGHDIQIGQNTDSIAKCDRAIAEPTTRGGCNDPCPKD